MYHDFYNLRAGDLVWLASKPERPATAEAFAELREFFGAETIDPILAGSWAFVERVSATGRAHPAGASARLRGPGDYELVVHRDDLRTGPAQTRPALRVVSPEAPQPSAPPAVEPPRCDDRPRPGSWKLNRKIGAVYVEAEPGGTARVSLVAAQGDGTSRCEAEMRGLAPGEVERTAAMFAARLAGRVAPATEERDAR